MTNHIHLIAVPLAETSLAQAIGRTHYLYTLHINRSQQRSGHLWQNRFFSCALDELHMYVGLRYVEQNPVRANLVSKAWDYRWSSALAHCGGMDESGLLDMNGWREKWNSAAWREELARDVSPVESNGIRGNTQTGRPCGAPEFVGATEQSLSRILHALPLGRPKSRASDSGTEEFEFG